MSIKFNREKRREYLARLERQPKVCPTCGRFMTRAQVAGSPWVCVMTGETLAQAEGREQ